MMRGTVIIFVKAPRAGKVKTRLGAEIGMGRAAALFRVMTERTIAEAMKGGWRTVLAVDPPAAVSDRQGPWPVTIDRIPQGGGDLGDRMGRAFSNAANGPVIIIGADAPRLRARHLRQAFASLRSADAVFGPAVDGGYWLIGLAGRRSAPNLFKGVRWSTRDALGDTLETLPLHFSVNYLETLCDIDEADDLAAMRPRSVA